MSERTRERAAKAIRAMIQRAHPDAQVPEGEAEEAVDAITEHVLAESAERLERRRQPWDRW